MRIDTYVEAIIKSLPRVKNANYQIIGQTITKRVAYQIYIFLD